MADDIKTPYSKAPSGMNRTLAETELETLRSLLLGPEYRSIQKTNEILNDPVKLSELIVPVLTQSFQIDKSSKKLQKSFSPIVVDALMDSVSDNPKPIADALYPVMGPAIRRSISSTMTQMTNNFNELLEQSVSPKAWQWRFDAWRTGRSYSEVVLIKNLVYQVEQVFLIHQKTGLLLQHVVAEDAISTDPDMVSGMLTAIQDFTSDSFETEQNSGLNSLKLGDLTVLIENGPHAIISAVVRGSVPMDLQNQLVEIVEEVHLQENKNLVNYKGDSSRFSHLKPILSGCLKTQLMNQKKKKKSKPESKFKPYIKPAIYFSLFAAVAGFSYSAYTDSLKNDAWVKIQDTLQSEPGLIVTQAKITNDQYKIYGLIDPLATDPSLLIKRGTGNNIEVDLDFKPYLSMDPQFVLKRLKIKFDVPDSIKLTLNNNILTLSGRCTQSWLDKFESVATKLEGINALNIKDLKIVGTK